MIISTGCGNHANSHISFKAYASLWWKQNTFHIYYIISTRLFAFIYTAFNEYGRIFEEINFTAFQVLRFGGWLVARSGDTNGDRISFPSTRERLNVNNQMCYKLGWKLGTEVTDEGKGMNFIGMIIWGQKRTFQSIANPTSERHCRIHIKNTSNHYKS